MPEKALYWHQQELLVIADLHLGKVAHFRKEGFAIPVKAGESNFRKLDELIALAPVKRVIFLGDLFHSVANADWIYFLEWLKQYPEIQMTLVKGNHDILPPDFYAASAMEIFEENLQIDEFLFTHIPLDEDQQNSQLYTISGHIHPGVRMYGKGRDMLTLPCYLFGQKQALLPAFGSFTGYGIVQAKVTDQVYVIAGEKVMRVN